MPILIVALSVLAVCLAWMAVLIKRAAWRGLMTALNGTANERF